LIEAPFFEYDPAGTFKNEYRVFGSTLVVTDGLGQVRWFDPLGFNETFPVSRNFPEKLPSYGFLMHQLTMHRHGYLTAATHIGGGQMSIYRWRPEDFIIPVT